MKLSNLYIPVLLISSVALLHGCASTNPAASADEGGQVTIEQQTEATGSRLASLLEKHRTYLRSVYNTQKHDMPEPFLQKDTTANEVVRNPFDGFRVQILSTRNVATADSVSTEFRLWAQDYLEGYVPKSYVFFKQPYYKVHVGDFHNRQKAIQLSRLLKRKYPEAWVVHDRINPGEAPADTVGVKIVPPEKRKKQNKMNEQGNRP